MNIVREILKNRERKAVKSNQVKIKTRKFFLVFLVLKQLVIASDIINTKEKKRLIS
jgi:hypothetical protein